MVYILGAALPEGVSGHDMGRRLLRELWCRHGVGTLPEILTEPMGKPYFVTGGFHFSITHTKRNAFCALAAVPVGLDAEEKDRTVRQTTAQRALAPRERTAWEASKDPNGLFLRLWVVKEAWVKCTGAGLGDPRRVEVNPVTFQPGEGFRAECFETSDCYLALCLEKASREKVTLEILP